MNEEEVQAYLIKEFDFASCTVSQWAIYREGKFIRFEITYTPNSPDDLPPMDMAA